jgi:hypothetical protein
MELGPISGIRSVTLLQAKRAEKGDSPLFVIDASARTGDEPSSPDQQTPGGDLDRDPDNAPEEQAADGIEASAAEDGTDNEQDHPETPCRGSHNWFV